MSEIMNKPQVLEQQSKRRQSTYDFPSDQDEFRVTGELRRS